MPDGDRGDIRFYDEVLRRNRSRNLCKGQRHDLLYTSIQPLWSSSRVPAHPHLPIYRGAKLDLPTARNRTALLIRMRKLPFKDRFFLNRAGATAVEVGTASFWDPGAVNRIAGELDRFLGEEKIATVTELVGSLRFPCKS